MAEVFQGMAVLAHMPSLPPAPRQNHAGGFGAVKPSKGRTYIAGRIGLPFDLQLTLLS